MLLEVLTDDRDPRASGADSLLNNSGELWALAEAFLWLRDESGDDKTVSVTLVYDSEVAKGLVTEPWALERPTKHLVGFVDGVIGCFGLKPIVPGTRGFALSSLRSMTRWSRRGLW